MDEDSQWYVLREFLTLVASYLVVKVVEGSRKETPTAFKNFDKCLEHFQNALQVDLVLNGRPETEEERLKKVNDGQ